MRRLVQKWCENWRNFRKRPKTKKTENRCISAAKGNSANETNEIEGDMAMLRAFVVSFPLLPTIRFGIDRF